MREMNAIINVNHVFIVDMKGVIDVMRALMSEMNTFMNEMNGVIRVSHVAITDMKALIGAGQDIAYTLFSDR